VLYMLTGSLASSVHGMPRASNDFDIVIAPTPEQLRVLKTLLPEPQYYFDLGWTPRAYSELEADFMRNKIAGRVRIREVRGANRKFADRPRGRFSRRRNHMEPAQRNLGPSPRQMGTARSNIGIP